MDFRIDIIEVGTTSRGVLRSWVYQTEGKEWESEAFADGIPPLDWKSTPAQITPGLGLYLQVTRIF